MKPTALLAEDEPLLRLQLAELLGQAWPDLEIVAQAEDGAQALQALEEHQPHVLFLDIEMPEASGLEVARLASGRCHVVFVTAYDQFAVAAFEEGAVDYVMKPVSARRIAMAVDRVKARMGDAPARLEVLLDQLSRIPKGHGRYLRWINASRGEDVQLITTDEVRYFQSDTKYTRVVATGREGLIRKSIKELSQELDPQLFWQIHRATIVNLDAIERVTRDLRGNVVLRLKEREEVLQA
jgi:DNA-binding LytR/AlgR family response regulator